MAAKKIAQNAGQRWSQCTLVCALCLVSPLADQSFSLPVATATCDRGDKSTGPLEDRARREYPPLFPSIQLLSAAVPLIGSNDTMSVVAIVLCLSPKSNHHFSAAPCFPARCVVAFSSSFALTSM